MAKIILDMSGRGGLLERYQGDLNDISSSPHLRYLGGDNQMAEGQFNPFSYYGYMSPPNNTFTSITGTIAAPINSFSYDNSTGILYASETGSNILQFSDLEDTSAANYNTISTGTIKDMVMYEVNADKALVFAIDSEASTGMYLGFKSIDTTKGIETATYDVNALSSGKIDYSIVREADTDESTKKGRKFGQAFLSDDLSSLYVSGVELAAKWDNITTPSGITLQVSIQGNSTKSTGVYTDQGFWADSTAYAINDVTTYSGNDYLCVQAHTSATANDRPSTGSDWEQYWTIFIGAPDGTPLATATITADNLPEDDGSTGVATADLTRIEFASAYTLTSFSQYWLVVEESGSNLGAGELLQVTGTINDNGIYATEMVMMYMTDGATDFWNNVNSNQDILETMHFRLYSNYEEDLSSQTANGAFTVETGQDTFLYLADNGLLYWFTGNSVNSFDGSATGGVVGTVNEAVLLFPSYTTIPDVAETRGRMYIGVQTSDRSSSLDTKFFNAHRSGVFVWDRRSQVLGGSDFFPTPGAKEIRNLFTSSTGDVLAITVNNSGFCELRALSGNQFAVIQTMEKGAYPESRRGISQVGNFTVWLGYNGIFYAYGAVAPGEPLRLYKIGTAAGLTSFATPGAIFVGNKDSSANELAVYFGWDTGAAYNISKWYPNGEGTIDSNAQKAGVGNVYTRVQQLPSLSNVLYIRGFHMPGGSDGDATVAATLKCYTNQSSTAAWSLDLTYDDLFRGWFEKEWNKQNVNFLQFEVEWNATPTLGSSTYRPMYLEIETKDEGRINP